MSTEPKCALDPKEVRNWKIYTYCLSLSLGAIAAGYDVSVMGGMFILPAFARDFGLTSLSDKARDDLTSNIVSAFQAGTFFASLGSCIFSERFGRKRSLIGCICVFLLGAVLMVCCSGNIAMLIAGRVLAGLGFGAAGPVMPIYIAEIAPPSIRGRLIGILEVSCQSGAMFGFWINYVANRSISAKAGSAQWQVPMALQMIPGLLMAITVPFCPETPRWLCKKGRVQEAQATLCKIRELPSDHPYIKHEMREMKDEVAFETSVAGCRSRLKSQFKHIVKKGVRNRIGIGFCLMMCQNMTGVNIVTYYSPRIFATLGIKSTDTTLLATGFYGVAKTVGMALFALWVADHLGRRKGLIYGAFLGAVPMFYIGGYILKVDTAHSGVTSSGWGGLAMACIYLFGIIFCASWQGITCLYASEIYPLHIRSLCMALTVANDRLWTYVISCSTPYMISDLGYATFFLFGSLLVLMGFWSMWCIRETKGIPIEKMDRLFGVPPDQTLDEEQKAISEVHMEEFDKAQQERNNDFRA